MNSGRECRICMIDSQEEDEELIQPCRCTTAFVHESCLQKWRDENIDNDRYNQCEICKASYIIHRQFPKETFKINIFSTPFWSAIWFYLVNLLIGSLIIGLIDMGTNFHSIVLLNGGKRDEEFIKQLDTGDVMTWGFYYVNYTSYLTTMFLSLYILINIVFKVHRKKEYIKRTGCCYLGYFVVSWNYFYNYYIFYKVMNRIDIYMLAAAISATINFLMIKQTLKLNNDVIRALNTNNNESIISVRYNPLIEITTLEELADEMN